MKKMFEKNYLSENAKVKGNGFGVPRFNWPAPYGKDKRHEGIDYSGMNFTKLNIYNLIDGVISHIDVIKDDPVNHPYGMYVQIAHDPKFIGGPDETIYSKYCHLESIDDNIYNGKFVKNGDFIGIMGHSGHCIPANKDGTHLHFMFFQPGEKQTKILNDILDKLGIEFTPEVAFFQWGKLFINPEIIIKYFEKLQGSL